MKRAEILLNLVIGICGSLVASLIYSRLQKIHWRRLSRNFNRRARQVTNDFLVHSVIASYVLKRTALKLVSAVPVRFIAALSLRVIPDLFSFIVFVSITLWVIGPKQIALVELKIGKIVFHYTEPESKEIGARESFIKIPTLKEGSPSKDFKPLFPVDKSKPFPKYPIKIDP